MALARLPLSHGENSVYALSPCAASHKSALPSATFNKPCAEHAHLLGVVVLGLVAEGPQDVLEVAVGVGQDQSRSALYKTSNSGLLVGERNKRRLSAPKSTSTKSTSILEMPTAENERT